MIRGDEELFSIMDEMTSSSTSQPSTGTTSNRRTSYTTPTDYTTRGDDSNITNDSSGKMNNYQIRLLPEIQGYGDYTSSLLSKEDCTLWNPYVKVQVNHSARKSKSFTKQPLVLIPTNPDVEVIRRRVYEKFKSKFYTNFQWVVNNNNNNNGNGNGNGNISKQQRTTNNSNVNNNNEIYKKLWEHIPSHNILERFHFASKLEESIKIMMTHHDTTIHSDHNHNDRSMNINSDPNYYNNHWTVNDIQTLWMKHKANGTIMDPILLSSPLPSIVTASNHNHSSNSNQSTLKQKKKHNNSEGDNDICTTKTNHVLFKNEIIFQLTREMRKKVSSTSTNTSKQEKAIEELRQYLKSSNFQRKCKRLSKDMDMLSVDMEREFIMQVVKRSSELATSSSSSSLAYKRRGIPKVSIQEQRSNDDSGVKEVMAVTYSGLSFRISLPHYKKLQILFDRNNTNSSTMKDHQDSFCKKLFSVLCRYDMLEGGGLQSALSGNVFDVLLNRLDCNMECFASPFNCRYERYCSAFSDTDMVFGSMGSFFDFQFESLVNGGCFQANPPFTADFILAMYKRMDQLLSNDKLTAPFMFIVFIPAWTYSEGWQTLAQSSLLSRSILLSQKDHPHYYCEGTQHRRLKDRYRVASFDTSVFFLQNDKARKKWPVTDEIINEVKIAFATNPDEEVKVNEKIKTKSRTNHGSNKVEIKEVMSTHGAQQMKEEKKHTKASHDSISNQHQKKRKLNKEMKQKVAKKKKLIDDSSTQFDILSSIGILDTK